MKNIKHTLVTLSLWTLTWYGVAQPRQAAVNLFAFVTWFSLFCFVITLGEASRKRVHQTYIDGKHAPRWFDTMTYTPIIVLCAATGDFWKAVAWAVIASIDFSHREAASEKS